MRRGLVKTVGGPTHPYAATVGQDGERSMVARRSDLHGAKMLGRGRGKNAAEPQGECVRPDIPALFNTRRPLEFCEKPYACDFKGCEDSRSFLRPAVPAHLRMSVFHESATRTLRHLRVRPSSVF